MSIDENVAPPEVEIVAGLQSWSAQIGAEVLRQIEASSAYPLTGDEREVVKAAAFAGSALTVESIQRLDIDLGVQVVLKILGELVPKESL